MNKLSRYPPTPHRSPLTLCLCRPCYRNQRKFTSCIHYSRLDRARNATFLLRVGVVPVSDVGALEVRMVFLPLLLVYEN